MWADGVTMPPPGCRPLDRIENNALNEQRPLGSRHVWAVSGSGSQPEVSLQAGQPQSADSCHCDNDRFCRLRPNCRQSGFLAIPNVLSGTLCSERTGGARPICDFGGAQPGLRWSRNPSHPLTFSAGVPVQPGWCIGGGTFAVRRAVWAISTQ